MENSEPSNTTRHILTAEDIKKLVQSPLEQKMDITKKISEYYRRGGFDNDQKKIAAKVFRVLIEDTELVIRKTLAQKLKNIKDVPRDVVIAMAHDVEEVSLPILECSKVLTDIDLIEIVNSTSSVEKQVAIAKREGITEVVTEALINTRDDSVVDSLLHNKTAAISETGYETMIEDFAGNDKVMESLLTRQSVPVEVVEKLTEAVSESIYDRLFAKHPDIFSKITDELDSSNHVVSMKVMGMRTPEQDYERFQSMAAQLHIDNEILPIAALCVGNIDIFETCLSKSTKVPLLNIRTLVGDKSNEGFRAIYCRAGLPEDLYEASELLIQTIRPVQTILKNQDQSFLSKEKSEEIIKQLTIASSRGDDDIENIDRIISLIRNCVSCII